MGQTFWIESLSSFDNLTVGSFQQSPRTNRPFKIRTKAESKTGRRTYEVSTSLSDAQAAKLIVDWIELGSDSFFDNVMTLIDEAITKMTGQSR